MTPLAKGLLAAVVLALGFFLQAPFEAARGAGLALLVYLPLYALRAAGGGDLKLMAAVGAFSGPAAWVTIFVINAVMGGAAAIALALAKGRLRQTLANTAHILRSGASLSPPHREKPELDIAHRDALTLPRGAFIAAATLLYLAAG
jgi:prepilin peptidase CpaA